MRFHKITLSGFLSFGWEPTEVELRPLNVLIGPNGSGKSNLIAAFGVLKALPSDLAGELRGLGAADVIHKGPWAGRVATIEVELASESSELKYLLMLHDPHAGRLLPGKEALHGGAPDYLNELMVRQGGDYRPGASKGPWVEQPDGVEWNQPMRPIDPSKSVLQQARGSVAELSVVAQCFDGVSRYAEWSFGRTQPARQLQPADLPTDALLEDASNLALVLNELSLHPEAMARIDVAMKAFYPGFVGLKTRVAGNRIQLFLQEGSPPVLMPATRLSDGTLRFLSLLAVLCHHSPPPLVCIEEPELGLHPDLIPTVADLLRDASTRTQLIVTTHSDALIDCFTKTPEDVLVCERDDDGTHIERLDPEHLKSWLERYRLGTLWRRGDIGGNRW